VVCHGRELAARLPGRAACFVVLSSTNETALEIVPRAALEEHAVDVPSSLDGLDGLDS
jgi:uncharacterized protein (DUF2237 family)